MSDKIILVKPAKEHKLLALDYKKEHFDFGEQTIHGSELLDRIASYEDWLNHITQNSNAATVDKNWVLTDTFFAVRESDEKIIGIIDLRYQLNNFLKDFGHCGYSVRPSERNKGYATKMLSQVCIMAKEYGLKELQLSAAKENLPSIKTILNNGGVYQRSFRFEDESADIYLINFC